MPVRAPSGGAMSIGKLRRRACRKVAKSAFQPPARRKALVGGRWRGRTARATRLASAVMADRSLRARRAARGPWRGPGATARGVRCARNFASRQCAFKAPGRGMRVNGAGSSRSGRRLSRRGEGCPKTRIRSAAEFRRHDRHGNRPASSLAAMRVDRAMTSLQARAADAAQHGHAFGDEYRGADVCDGSPRDNATGPSRCPAAWGRCSAVM